METREFKKAIQEREWAVIGDRVDDIRDVLTIINSILSWERLSHESEQQLLVFKEELESELRWLLQSEQQKAA